MKHNRRSFFSRVLAAITGAAGLLALPKKAAAKLTGNYYDIPSRAPGEELVGVIPGWFDVNTGNFIYCLSNSESCVLPTDRTQIVLDQQRLQYVMLVWRKRK